MPRFAVLIPTRDRPDTVVRAVASVLRQPSTDLGLVVHDNSTDDATVEALADLGDPRLRVVRHPGELTMTGNWEAGLGLLDADRVMVLGDDDALMPAALPRLERLLEDPAVGVVTWDKVKYSWPQRGFDRDKLKLPPARSDRMERSGDLLGRVLRQARAYEQLPMLYSSFVPMSVLDGIRGRTGRFVGSQSPDVYSGTAISLLMPRVLRSGLPLSISGLSRWSNGANAIASPANAAAAEWRARNATAGLALHPWLPDIRGLATAVYDSVLRAADDLGVDLGRHRRSMLLQVIQHARAFDADEVLRFTEAIGHAATTDARTRRAVARALGRDPLVVRPDPAAGGAGVRPLISANGVRLDASAFGVVDVMAAAELAHHFYDWSRPPARVVDARPDPGVVRRLLVRAAEAVRHRLVGAVDSDASR